MSYLNAVEACNPYYPPQEEGLIDKKLPSELFQNVLSYLDDNSLQKTAVVSRYWSAVSIDVARNKRFSQVTSFAKFLTDNLSDVYCREQLSAIPYGGKILGSFSLVQVTSSIGELKEQMITTIKELDEDTLKELEGLSAEKYFNNIFELARLYKKIEETGQISDDDARNQELCGIAKALVKCGSIDKAKEVILHFA